MRTLIASDIHSNIVAFEAVLRDASSRGPIDTIWSLGDIIGYGPRPNECLDTLRGHEHLGVAGNHDLGAIGATALSRFNTAAATACAWNGTQLTEENRSYVESLPSVIKTAQFTLVHASLRDPVWEYVVHEEAARGSFDLLTTPCLLLGHSHLPLVFAEDSLMPNAPPRIGPARHLTDGDTVDVGVTRAGRLIINPGSVGQPRDGDPRAAYLILDHEAGTLAHFRVGYDIEAVQRDMKAAGLPPTLAQRLAHGL